MPLPDDFEEKFAALKREYIAGLPEKLVELEHAFTTSNADAGSKRGFVRSAHSLAGTGSTFGFPDLTRLAREIELAAKEEVDIQGPWSTALHDLFRHAVHTLKDSISRELAV